MSYSYDDIYVLHAWRDNRRRLVLTQGEGYSGTITNNDVIKAPRFQLRDERDVIEIPSSGSPSVQLAVTRSNHTEDLLACTVVDRENGIISCPITKSLTDVAGEVKGEIRLVTANSVTKFYGVDFYIFDGVSDAAAAQSSQFSALIEALQQVGLVISGGSSGTVALDTVIQYNGTKPVASGIIYNYLQGNYRQISFAHENNESSYDDGGVYIDDATDIMKMYYVKNSNGARVGILFCVQTPGYNYGTQVKIDAYGNITTRVKTKESGEADYTWKSWTPVGTTRNIQDGAVTTPKLANGAVTSAKIGSGEVKTTNVNDGAVTTAKIADSAVTAGKLDSNAVTTQKIADSAVTADKLGSSAVTTAKINDGAVTADKLGSSAVTTGKINDGAVTNGKLADGAVTEGKIGNGAVTQDKIASSAYETTPTNGSSKFITSGGVYTFANGNFRKYKSITSSEVDDAIDQQTLYSVYYQGFFSILYCVVGSSNRTQYLHKSTGDVLYRSQSLSDAWGDWNDWKYVASQNVYRKSSRPTTSSASKLWDIRWYTDSSSVEHCYQLTSIGGTSENLVYNWTEIATSTSLANQVVVFSYTLTSNGWNANNEQTVTKPSSYVVTSDVIADAEIGSTAYNQLCADGCGGIYISSERSGSTLTLTAHALNNKPTANVTIQVTLTKVSDLSE